MPNMIVRNPTTAELEVAAKVASKAFPNLSPEHWQWSFHNVARMFGERYVLVVELDGQIVSSLVCGPAPIHVGKGLVSHSSVGGVGTLPECRQMGCAGAMMAETVRLLRSESIYTSSLWPFSYEYYRKFGWEVGAEIRSYSAEPKVFAPLGDPGKVHGATEDDLPRIKAAYNAFAVNYNCLTERYDDWWTNISEMKPDCLRLATESGRGVIVHGKGKAAKGYAVYEVHPGEGEKSIGVREMAFAEPEHRRDMLAKLASLDGVTRVDFSAPIDDRFLHELPNPRAVNTTIHPSFQFRVIDPEKAMLSLVTDEYVSGKISFSVSDPVFEEGFEFGIEFQEGHAVPCAYDHNTAIQTDVMTFAKLFSGYLTPLDAWELGRIEVPGDVMQVLAMACQSFSPLTPYRTWLEPG